MCWTFAFTLVTRSLTVVIQDATTLKGNKTGSVFTAQPHKTNWSLAASDWSVKAQMKWLDGAAQLKRGCLFSPINCHLNNVFNFLESTDTDVDGWVRLWS